MTNQKKNSRTENVGEQVQVQSDGHFLITGDLDFYSVPKILSASQSLFEASQSLTIDLSGVESSNSAGLALLIEWMRIADSKSCPIKFLNVPDQLRQVAQLCGVEEKLPV
ncbi:STAS domain-containing protein [Kaarinaea lacus]